MKAVAITLVLIIAAAVILWYGNTLNSWVLGGLIGGLAALLVSIPLSLLFFSHLSKRHDEQLRAEEEEEIALAQEYDYPLVSERVPRRPQEVESYVVVEEPMDDEWFDDAQEARKRPRALPAPKQRLDAPRQHTYPSRNLDRLPALPHATSTQPAKRTQQLYSTGKETAYLRPTTRKLSTTGHEYSTPLSQHRTQALRAARLEAVKQKKVDEDIEEIPTNFPRREIISRPSHALAKQEQAVQRPSRPARQMPLHSSSSRPNRNVVDSHPSQQSERLKRSDHTSKKEIHTENIRSTGQDNDAQETVQQYPRVPTRRSSRNDKTEPIKTRDLPFFEEEDDKEDTTTTSNSYRTLQRRAPYMYDDDPMRQEFEQQLDAPSVRRSSRYKDEGTTE